MLLCKTFLDYYNRHACTLNRKGGANPIRQWILSLSLMSNGNRFPFCFKSLIIILKDTDQW